MFVYSIKTSKGKMLLGLGIAAAVIILLIMLFSGGGDTAETASTKTKIDYSASTADQRVAFLKQFGWEVKPEPISVTEELIPEEFDQTYEEYNTIQKMQSLDLSKYKGKRVKKWTFEVTNYPNSDSAVNANLLVLDGKVIGGDVCSTEKDGFMHGFSGDTQTGAGVDVVYELTDDGALIVQNNTSSVVTPDGGNGGTGGNGNTNGGGTNGDANGGGTGGGTGDTGNGGTGGNGGGTGDGTGGGTNGESGTVSNPQTGDDWS